MTITIINTTTNRDLILTQNKNKIEKKQGANEKDKNGRRLPVTGHRQQAGGSWGAPGRHKLHNQRTPSWGSNSP